MFIGIFSERKTWEVRELIKAAERRGHEVKMIDYIPLLMYSGYKKIDVLNTKIPDVIIFTLLKVTAIPGVDKKIEDDVGLVLMQHFERMGVEIINTAQAIAESEHKYNAHLQLMQNNLPTPVTCYAQTPAVAFQFIDEVIGYPAVIKPLFGCQGQGITKVNNAKEAKADLSARNTYPLIVEEYIEKVGNRDIRVFTVGSEAIAGMYRIAKKNTFITNAHAGGTVKGLKSVPEELGELAVKAAESLNLKISGIDVMEDPERGYLIAETNSVPGFAWLYDATNVNMAPKIIEHAEELVKK
jgi:RimK family alpha-L-glutamate ligase